MVYYALLNSFSHKSVVDGHKLHRTIGAIQWVSYHRSYPVSESHPSKLFSTITGGGMVKRIEATHKTQKQAKYLLRRFRVNYRRKKDDEVAGAGGRTRAVCVRRFARVANRTSGTVARARSTSTWPGECAAKRGMAGTGTPTARTARPFVAMVTGRSVWHGAVSTWSRLAGGTEEPTSPFFFLLIRGSEPDSTVLCAGTIKDKRHMGMVVKWISWNHYTEG